MPIVNGYATRDELKVWASIDLDVNNLDDLIDKAINASSRGLDKFCKRHFYQVDEIRRFESVDRCTVRFGTYSDLVSVTALATDDDGDGVFETAWAAADFELAPVRVNAAPEPKPYREVVAIKDRRFPIVRKGSVYRVQINGKWGWPGTPPIENIPDAIHEASLLQSSRLLKRREAPEGVIGLNMFGTVRLGRLDPDVAALAKPYRIHVVG